MKKIILTVYILVASVAISCAFNNENTHPIITKKAASPASSRFDSYLKNSLGFVTGVDTYIYYQNIENGSFSFRSISDLLKAGAQAEDVPMCRAANHFYNPINNTGLSDVLYSAMDPLGITMPGPFPLIWTPTVITIGNAHLAYCSAIEPSFTGRSFVPWLSTVTWATGYVSSGSPAKITTTKQTTGNEWDWDHTRNAYYLALVSVLTQTRENYFAATFFGLGHELHLLQDMAVPAHVRNDFLGHVKPEWFEKYVSMNSQLITDAPAIDIANASYTTFWDADLYDGTNPDVTMLLPGLTDSNLTSGLAEYTNANFLSKNTMLTEDYIQYSPYYFPYPRASATVLWKDTTNNTKYIKKKGDGEIVNHLATVSKLYAYRVKYFPETSYFLPLKLDDKCHYDYATKLLPRAVGYSAGLLNYFFRGTIDIALPSSGIYAMTESSGTGFTNIKLIATNTTATGESMTNGTIELVVKYKKALTDPFKSDAVEKSPDFAYIVVPEKNNVSALYSARPTELNFDLSQHPIPLWATDLYLQVVYHGKLGNEDGAVAVGFKDISEPTPIDDYNNMDRICINGQWYVTGSQEAYDALPGSAKWWDYWAHKLSDVYVKISPSDRPSDASPTNYTFYTAVIEPGTLNRRYILSDYSFVYSSYGTMTPEDINDLSAHNNVLKRLTVNGQGVRNQEEDWPVLYPFRGVKIWGPGGMITDGLSYPNYTDPAFIPCSWSNLQW